MGARNRDHLDGSSPKPPRRLSRAGLLGIVAAAALLATACGAVPRITMESGNATVGEHLFKTTCSPCHTLAAAGTSGMIGPDLDWAFGPSRCQGFSQTTILNVIRGQIAYADQLPESDWPPGSGIAVQGMPPDLVTGQDARDVAVYVASVAGVTHGPGPHFDCATGAMAG